MDRRIGNLVVEVTGVESAKFTAPLLLVHGLWGSAEVWRRATGFLAHRGWACHALNLRGRRGAPPATQLPDYEDDLRGVVAAMETSPVIVGHDLGALLALRAAGTACAIVALAPWVPRPFDPAALVGLVRGCERLAFLRAGAVGPPRGARGRAYFGDPTLPVFPEPAAVLRAIMREQISCAAGATPMLVVAGGRDPFVSLAAVQTLARHLGATLRIDDTAGHALPVETGWERRVGDMHRWLIQQLGDPLLALREESEAED